MIDHLRTEGTATLGSHDVFVETDVRGRHPPLGAPDEPGG